MENKYYAVVYTAFTGTDNIYVITIDSIHKGDDNLKFIKRYNDLSSEHVDKILPLINEHKGSFQSLDEKIQKIIGEN